MKVLLLFPDEDFNLSVEPSSEKELLVKDLELTILFNAMSLNDSFIYEVIAKTILSDVTSLETIVYRQDILKDCLQFPDVIKDIYELPIQLNAKKHESWMGILSHSPSSILSEALQMLNILVKLLKKLRKITDDNIGQFKSAGFQRFFSMIQEELNDQYFDQIDNMIEELRFKKGVLMSVELGKGNEGFNYILRKRNSNNENWLKKISDLKRNSYSYALDPKDFYGGQALSELKDRVINQVANAVAQSAEQIDGFIKQIQIELAFYIGCINLRNKLIEFEEPISFPKPRAACEIHHVFTELYDINLALTLKDKVVSNDFNLSDKTLILITGANQGGKSTFLRSIGLAQVMMQCGMFVPAQHYEANICNKTFTHFKREEDSGMKSGKFVEELKRMSFIIDRLKPNSLVLLNESFASTNEREGSEIAKQIIKALNEKNVKIFFVSHMYSLANFFYESHYKNALFLLAKRNEDGTRPFKLQEGEPMRTSFGKDLYYSLFS